MVSSHASGRLIGSCPSSGGALGPERVDREIILPVHPGREIRPSGGDGMAAELLDGVFVAVLGMNGFAAAEFDRLAADPHFLPDQTDDMHLHPALLLIVEGTVAEIRRVERAGKLAIDAQQN